MSEKVLEPDNPSTLTSVYSMALGLQSMERYDEAMIMYRRALEGSEKVLGHRYPEMLKNAHNLASLFDKQGQHDEASDLYLRASEGMLKALGPDHPHTQRCLEDYQEMIDKMERKGTDVRELRSEFETRFPLPKERMKRKGGYLSLQRLLIAYPLSILVLRYIAIIAGFD